MDPLEIMFQLMNFQVLKDLIELYLWKVASSFLKRPKKACITRRVLKAS